MTRSTLKSFIALGAVLGVGLLVVQSRRYYREHNGSGIVLDPDLDHGTRIAVLTALELEHDSAILHEFASRLDKAGHHVTASIVSRRARELG
jgi:hypothetical protein